MSREYTSQLTPEVDGGEYRVVQHPTTGAAVLAYVRPIQTESNAAPISPAEDRVRKGPSSLERIGCTLAAGALSIWAVSGILPGYPNNPKDICEQIYQESSSVISFAKHSIESVT